jgi:hypothetical protein
MARTARLLLPFLFVAALAQAAAPKTPAPKKPDTAALKAELVKTYGDAARPRIERGVDQVAALWRADDGDLAAFARTYFIADQATLDATFARFEDAEESLGGYFLAMSRDLKRPSDLDLGPLLPVDPLFGGFDASAHLSDDLFANKLAFVALLNFPVATLDQRLADGKTWTRRQWAEVRLTQGFSARIPADVQQAMTKTSADGDLYIAGYNVWMHHLVNERGERLFPKGLRLISHWNLRDELKADYDDPKAGLDKQRTIVKVMERIVAQTIPQVVIDNPRVDWNPFTNEVKPAPADEVEADAPPARALPKDLSAREPDTRYAVLLAEFRAQKAADPYTPAAPSAIARSFDGGDIAEARVTALFTQVLESPLAPRVAAEIEKRLGRKLEPADLWYAGFRPRGAKTEADLDKLTRKRYPTAAAFAKDVPRLLKQLGFSPKQIQLVTSHLVVDPARGAGHAMQAGRRGDDTHLRTRVEKDGMNYKGYNIAVHELGHNVEQVFSLYEVDHTLLAGVPITAITEALAFVFQHKDLELLGLGKPGADADRERALDAYWEAWEISGVALVELRVWHWMYDHPDATAEKLREATLAIAREVWNRYYEPLLGGHDTVLLGVYSHMLSIPLYLYNYPLGHLIAFQIEEQMNKAGKGKLGAEFERMATMGRVTPDLWMEHATGAPVGADALLRATEAALAAKK